MGQALMEWAPRQDGVGVPAILLRPAWVRARRPVENTQGPSTDAGSAVAGARNEAEALEGDAAEPPAKEEIILGKGSKVKQKQINRSFTRRC
jgi:hypothetical protein